MARLGKHERNELETVLLNEYRHVPGPVVDLHRRKHRLGYWWLQCPQFQSFVVSVVRLRLVPLWMEVFNLKLSVVVLPP